MEWLQTVASTLGLGLLAGVRLYATVLALGLAIRFGWIDLSPSMSALAVVADTRVLVVAVLMWGAEFIADKVAWFDTFWDGVHTFIRPIGAVLLGIAAAGQFDPAAQAILALLCGGIALTGHSTKAATRLLVNHSPEPFSNIAMSVGEEILVPLGVWLAMAQPALTLFLVCLFLAVFIVMFRYILRLMKAELKLVGGIVRRIIARVGSRVT